MRALVLAVLVLDSVLLALMELLFLPLHVGSVAFPVSVLLAAVATPWLVGQAATVSRRGVVAGAPLLTWFVVVLGVGLGGPGGEAVLPADWRSPLLLAAGTLPAALTLGRVIARRGTRDGGSGSGGGP